MLHSLTDIRVSLYNGRVPNPETPPAAVDEQFNAKIHCGALNVHQMPCKQLAGYHTLHVGSGRCIQHDLRETADLKLSEEAQARLGTAMSLLPQRRAGAMRTFRTRVEAARDSDDLLTLDTEIAILKVVMEDELENYVNEKLEWQTMMQRIENGEYDQGEEPQLVMPHVPLETLNTLQRLVKLAYDMRFAKRFSVPISELEAVVNQIRNAFVTMCQKYGIPDEAKIEFANELMSLRLSQKTDWQLARAGGESIPQLVGES